MVEFFVISFVLHVERAEVAYLIFGFIKGSPTFLTHFIHLFVTFRADHCITYLMRQTFKSVWVFGPYMLFECFLKLEHFVAVRANVLSFLEHIVVVLR